MKFWILTTEYPPFYGGGISTYCYFTAKMFVDKGHEVTVFVNDNTINEVKVEYHQGVRLVRFNPSLSELSLYLGFTTCISYGFAQVVKQFIVDEGKPDIIEAQEYLGIAYYLLQYKYLQYDWCKDLHIAITMHSPAFLYLEYNHVPLYQYPNYWIGEMERFCLQGANVLISPSKFLIHEVSQRFELNESHIHVIENPYEFKHVNGESFSKASESQIVFYGKLSVQKGTFKLLEYFENLWNQGFSEKLYLVGAQDIVYHPEGKTMGDIVRRKYKSFIDKDLLVLEEKIAPSETFSRLSKAKVVIVPSTVDNLPYVVMEMMSMGLIVLVSKQGGQAEIVEDGVNGFIFDHSDPDTFYSQLRRILTLTNEEKELISGKAIDKINRSYNLDLIYNKKIDVLSKSINLKPSSYLYPFLRRNQPDILISSSDSDNLLSIVIPYFNMGKYIDDTLESIYQSSYNQIEIIIVNDGSTDPDSIDKLNVIESGAHVRVIHTSNKGLASARNIGAIDAKGKYIAFLDADDKVSKEYYQKGIQALSKLSNVSFVGCWTQYFERSNAIWPTFTPEPPLILYHNLINSSSLIYKRNAFLEGGLNDHKMPFTGLEDYDSVISLVSNGYRGVVLPEIHFYYRVRKDSMIRGVSKVKKTILLDYICHKHQQIYKNYASDLYSLQYINGSGASLDNPSLDGFSNRFPAGRKIYSKANLLIKRNRYAKFVAYKVVKFFK